RPQGDPVTPTGKSVAETASLRPRPPTTATDRVAVSETAGATSTSGTDTGDDLGEGADRGLAALARRDERDDGDLVYAEVGDGTEPLLTVLGRAGECEEVDELVGHDVGVAGLGVHVVVVVVGVTDPVDGRLQRGVHGRRQGPDAHPCDMGTRQI